MPFVALCVADQLPDAAQAVRLDPRYFDTHGQPKISDALRRKVMRRVSRRTDANVEEKRRSRRIAQSLVVPAVELGSDFTPLGDAFQIMVANLSREGIGLVHDAKIEAEYVALELAPQGDEPIQAIVRVVRQSPLEPPYMEVGGEFFVRLG